MEHHFKAELRQKTTKLQGWLSPESGSNDLQPQLESTRVGCTPLRRGLTMCARRHWTHQVEAGQTCRGERERRRMPDHDRSSQRIGARGQNLPTPQKGLLKACKVDGVPASTGHAQAHSVADPVHYPRKVHNPHGAPLSLRRNITMTFPAGSTVILRNSARLAAVSGLVYSFATFRL